MTAFSATLRLLDGGHAAPGDRVVVERPLQRLRVTLLGFAALVGGVGALRGGADAVLTWTALGLLAVTAIVVEVALRRRAPNVGVIALLGDAAAAVSFLFASIADRETSAEMVVVVVILGAALRWGAVGGLAAGVGAALVTAGWSIVRVDRYGIDATTSVHVLRAAWPLVVGAGAGLCLDEMWHRWAVLRGVLEVSTDQLEEREQRYRSLFDHNPDAVFSLDREGRFTSANMACERLSGYRVDDLIGSSFLPLVRSDEVEQVTAYLRGALAGEPQAYEATIVHRQGREVDLYVNHVPIVVNGETVGVYGVAKDVTDRRHLERQLAHQAFHDRLTGLPNRALFLERLTSALDAGRTVAVLLLDIDRFKVVNDSLGHHAGDVLLMAAAHRLERSIRPGDLVARFGGDEFTVLLTDVDRQSEAIAVANRVLDRLNEPFAIQGRELVVSASVGIATTINGPARADELLRRADTAMYRAKEQGRARAELFDEDMDARAVARLEMETKLRHAIVSGQLVVHYQPVFSVQTGELHCVEALVRWVDPERGLLLPASFVPLAEESGLILALGRWVLDETCRQLAAWRRDQGATVCAAVNAAAVQVRDPGFVEEVAAAVARHGIDPEQLIIELVESAMLDDSPSIRATIKGLRALGVRLAVDDFGTGYSALSYLTRFPVYALKIDRSFVANLGREEGDAIVRAVVHLAQGLHLHTVAEGVETEAQLERLREIGCDSAQGFLLSRPLPAAELTAVVSEGRTLLPVAPVIPAVPL